MFLAMICLAQIAAAQVGKTGDDRHTATAI